MCQAIVQRLAGVFTYAKEWHEVGTLRRHVHTPLGGIRGSALLVWVERWSWSKGGSLTRQQTNTTIHHEKQPLWRNIPQNRPPLARIHHYILPARAKSVDNTQS
jgi:hypothetical protein